MAADINNIKINSDKETILRRLEERTPVILEKIGLIAERYAKMKCPVDTGRLRNSITHETDQDSAYIGTNVEYAPYVELGSLKQRAKPYLKPAILNHINEYNELIRNELAKD